MSVQNMPNDELKLACCTDLVMRAADPVNDGHAVPWDLDPWPVSRLRDA